MEVFKSPFNIAFETSVALGDFDGVHIAHRKVIVNCVKAAREKDLKSGVLLFKNSIKNTTFISSLDERIKEFEKLGADFVYLCDFDDDFRKKTPEEFIEFLKEKLCAKAVSAGFDYRFGYMAKGDINMLSKLCKMENIEVLVCDEQKIGEVSVSSSEIRSLIENNRLKEAKSFLGRPYSISGTVKKGFRNGHKLGFPTANLEAEEKRVLPPDGVYRGAVIFEGKKYRAVINIGKNPTFEAEKKTVESHLIDFEADLYDKEITVEFHEFLRSEIKFENIDMLKNQIKKDKERAIENE